jgi:uncharacterized membrane protein
MGVWFALLSSLAFAVSHIFIRRGLAQSNPTAGFCISISISALVLWFLAAMYLPLSSFWTHAILYFALSGIFATGLGRMLIYVGIDRIGVARSVPVAGSAPMFASILAVLVIGETWSLQNFSGTLLVILGIVVISRSRTEKMDWSTRDLIYPIMAALVFGLAANVRKLGLLVENVPLMASTVNATTGLLFSPLMIYARGGVHVLRVSRRTFVWFLAAGICYTTGMLLNFYALGAGKIVIVEPLINTNPVLSVLLTAIFLRDIEAVNLHVVTGVFFTVVGTVLLVLS